MTKDELINKEFRRLNNQIKELEEFIQTLMLLQDLQKKNGFSNVN